jgi:type I restriction enzyme, S subunit
MTDEKKTLTPKLRFPEFRDAGAWERRELSDLLIERKERNRQLKYGPEDVLSVSGEFGCVNQIELLGRSYAGVSLRDYHVVYTGDVVYTKSPLKKNPFGIIKENKGRSGIVSTLYAVYRATDIGLPAYLDHYFSRDYNLNAYLQPIVRKGAKNDMKVNNAAVLRGEIFAPNVEEQRKIAAFLTSLDEARAAEGRKLETLRDHKNGLMQQLFPREGETRPRLRFPEFRDAPEWEETSLGQLGSLVSGLTYSPADVRNEGLLVLRSSNVQGSEIAMDDCVYVTPDIRGANFAQSNDILICVRNGSKPLIGKNALIPDGMPPCTHGAFMTVLRAKAPQFVFQLLQTGAYHKQVAANLGATINSINGSQLLKYRFVAPEQDEQQRIAACLSSLDALIAAQSRKLDGLRAHKKGLMQLLFPSPAGV